jgi:hypothetical protein
LDDPNYIGEKWRGFTGYMEQAYLRYSSDYFQLTLGRDFLKWGAGKTGRLLLSDNAQPMDFLSLGFRYKGLSFSSIAADLDQWLLSDSLAQRYGVPIANRFLSAHRLTINFKNKLYLGFTEALLYGGPNSSWELKYHNPLLYYHGELLNGGGYDGNGLLAVDFDWYPGKNWEFYGEILVDDFQLEKTSPGDLEPNEIGMIFGFQHSQVFGLDGSWLGLEYVRIANRTYNSGYEWEKFVLFNRPIGYSLGNNFDRWHLTANYFPKKGLRVGMVFDYIRKGEGSILDSWDTPWVNYTVAEGYNEPFPYGIVERSFIAGLNVRFHSSKQLIFESEITYHNIENASHRAGKVEKEWKLSVRLHWDIRRILYY